VRPGRGAGGLDRFVEPAAPGQTVSVQVLMVPVSVE
jgi:hypothetical protein